MMIDRHVTHGGPYLPQLVVWVDQEGRGYATRLGSSGGLANSIKNRQGGENSRSYLHAKSHTAKSSHITGG